MHLFSRSLSIILAVVLLYRMWPNRDGQLSIALAMAAPLVLIKASIVFDPNWVMRFLYGP